MYIKYVSRILKIATIHVQLVLLLAARHHWSLCRATVLVALIRSIKSLFASRCVPRAAAAAAFVE